MTGVGERRGVCDRGVRLGVGGGGGGGADGVFKQCVNVRPSARPIRDSARHYVT